MSIKIVTKYTNIVVEGDNAPMDVQTIPFEIGDIVWCALRPIIQKKTRKSWDIEIEEDYAAYQGIVRFIGFGATGTCIGVDIPNYSDKIYFINYIWIDNSKSHFLGLSGRDQAVKWCSEQNMRNYAIRAVKTYPMVEE